MSSVVNKSSTRFIPKVPQRTRNVSVSSSSPIVAKSTTEKRVRIEQSPATSIPSAPKGEGEPSALPTPPSSQLPSTQPPTTQPIARKENVQSVRGPVKVMPPRATTRLRSLAGPTRGLRPHDLSNPAHKMPPVMKPLIKPILKPAKPTENIPKPTEAPSVENGGQNSDEAEKRSSDSHEEGEPEAKRQKIDDKGKGPQRDPSTKEFSTRGADVSNQRQTDLEESMPFGKPYITDLPKGLSREPNSTPLPSAPDTVNSEGERLRVIDPADLPKPGRGQNREILNEDGVKVIINVNTFTMGDLCKEIPIGDETKLSKDLENVKNGKKEVLKQISLIKKSAKAIKIPFHEVQGYRDLISRIKEGVEDQKEEFQTQYKKLGHGSSSGQAVAAPTLKMTSDGNFGVDEASTVIDRHAKDEKARDSMTRIHSEKRFINNATFSSNDRPDRWDEAETLEFYNALSMWGTDFNLISQMFPSRSRHQVKRKFKLEERRNATKVHLALLRKLPVDLEDYARSSRVKLESKETIEEELRTLRQKHEEMMKQEDLAREKARAADAEAALKADSMRFGLGAISAAPHKLTRAQLKKELRMNEEVIGTVGGSRT